LPSPAYSRYVLLSCFALTALNVMDRQVLSILIEPIRNEFSISDSLMGLLTGTAFALSHAVAMLPIARWADVGNRRDIMAAGMLIWSALTALTGAANAYWQLVLTRIGVGACETVGSGPAQSLLSDYFPPERRAGALSIHASGGTLGALVGFAIGGLLADLVGWRWTFVCFGVPGILLAVVMWLSVREPERGAIEGLQDSEQPGFIETLHYLAGLRTFRQVVTAGAINATVSWSLLTWAAAAMMRAHDLTTAEVGGRLALTMTLPMAGGLVLAGVLSDRLGRRDSRWYLWLPAMASTLAVPFSLAALLSGDPAAAFLWLTPGALFSNTWVGTYNSVVQGLAKPRMRAMGSAVHVLVGTAIGQGIGVPLVGVLSDWLEPTYGVDSLRYALCAVVCTGLWASLHALLAARTYPEDLVFRNLPATIRDR